MGYLRYLYDYDFDPSDTTFPYQPYEFVPVEMSMSRDFGRRESVMAIPSMDSVLDGYGRAGGPMDRRDMTFGFRKFTATGDLDADYDRLAAWLAPGNQMRLVYQTDSGALWYTTASNPRLQNSGTSGNNWQHGGFQDFTVTWRIRPDWRPRYPELQGAPDVYSTADNEIYAVADNEVYPAPGMTAISLASQPFTLDATGVAGSTLPTIPDTGPIFYLVGPCGGDAGIQVINYTSWAVDGNGVRQQEYFTLGFNLPTVHDSALVDFSRQAFYHNGIAFRPFKPTYQKVYFQVKNGIVNNCAINGLGANILTGGSITSSWWRKRA